MNAPKDILAITNPLVAVEIRAWQEGRITWTQALMNAVVALQQNNDYLMDRRQAPILAAAREAQALAEMDIEAEEAAPAKPTPTVAVDLKVRNRLAFFEKNGCWPEDPKARKLA